MTSSLRIIVSGLMAQHYTLAGVSWDYIQYVIGLHRMGHEVYYFEDSGEWPYTLDGGETGQEWVSKSCDKNIRHLNNIFSQFGLEERWAYFFPYESKWYGMPDQQRQEIMKTADLVINVSGTLEYPEKYKHSAKLIYIDSDPGFTQLKLIRKDEEFSKRVSHHDIHFSFGECLPEYLTEKLPYTWLPTRTPIVLDQWQTSCSPRNAYTTIMNWTSYPPIEFNKLLFGQKDTEFVKFLGLPNLVGNIDLEVALSRLQHQNWQSNIKEIVPSILIKNENSEVQGPYEFLKNNGWHVVDPDQYCGDFDRYREYIRKSKGEWSVAKGGYVVAQSGWFSCRSACYLAAGRPVIVQDTGFGNVLPVGSGILPFRTIDEARQAILEVEENYKKHSEAAFLIAESFFDANKVLTNIIDKSFMLPAGQKLLIKNDVE